jgi:hypothetical protein
MGSPSIIIRVDELNCDWNLKTYSEEQRQRIRVHTRMLSGALDLPRPPSPAIDEVQDAGGGSGTGGTGDAPGPLEDTAITKEEAEVNKLMDVLRKRASAALDLGLRASLDNQLLTDAQPFFRKLGGYEAKIDRPYDILFLEFLEFTMTSAGPAMVVLVAWVLGKNRVHRLSYAEKWLLVRRLKKEQKMLLSPALLAAAERLGSMCPLPQDEDEQQLIRTVRKKPWIEVVLDSQ